MISLELTFYCLLFYLFFRTKSKFCEKLNNLHLLYFYLTLNKIIQNFGKTFSYKIFLNNCIILL